MQHKDITLEQSKNSHKKWKFIFMIIAIVFACSTAFMSYQFITIKSKYTTELDSASKPDQEKENLIRYLNNIENTYAELIYEYEGLDSILTIEKSKVKDLKKEISQLKGSSDDYRTKVEELRARLEDYQEQINILKIKNEALTTENLKVKTELNDIITEKKNLEEKVVKGAALKAYEILAYGIRSKSASEELPTQNARLTDKIKTCFILSENALASKGNRNIYVRIFGPDGKILTNSNETFLFEGKNISYSIKKQIFYDNAAMDLCLYWEKPMEYIKGDYTVVLFAESQIIGSTYFTLE